MTPKWFCVRTDAERARPRNGWDAMNLFVFAQTAAGMAGYTSKTNTARCVPAAVFNVQTVVFVLVLFG